MARSVLFAPFVLAVRLGTYLPKLAHEVTHIAVAGRFVGHYDADLHPLAPTRFRTPEVPRWPLRLLAALAPTVVGTVAAVVLAATRPGLFVDAFTAVPYWLLYAFGVPGYLPPEHLLAWVGVDLFWFVYTWPSAEDRAALIPGSRR